MFCMYVCHTKVKSVLQPSTDHIVNFKLTKNYYNKFSMENKRMAPIRIPKSVKVMTTWKTERVHSIRANRESAK